MAPPDPSRPYELHTDACNYAVGGILIQRDDAGKERVIQYISQSLSATQRKWPTIEKEAYAVVFAIGKLRPYLYGTNFKVITDHKALKCLFTKEMVNTKIQRWGVLLAEYGAKIEYRKGKHNVRADMLSRIRPTEETAVIDVDDWVDPQAFPEKDIQELLPLLHDGLDLKTIALDQETEFPGLKEEALDPENGNFTLIDSVIYSLRLPGGKEAEYPCLVLPQAHQDGVIDRAHREMGHMAVEKTLHRVAQAYVWPGMRKSIRERLS